MPLPWLTVRPTDFVLVLFHERPDRRVAVHRPDGCQPDAIQTHDWQIVIERGKPPFVFVVLIGDEIGNAPCEEVERLPGETEWFVSGDRWFHGEHRTIERRSLHDGLGCSQGPVWTEFEGARLCL